MPSARLAVDIGGTFTDLALEHDGKLTTIKVLTTPAAPEQGVMVGVRDILQTSGVAAGDIGIVIHGTTLATNSVIERKGARTALLTTQGFRDVIAMGNESRYEQYDLNIVLPEPLVPRYLRLPVPERLDNEGNVLLPLDVAAVRALTPVLMREGVESIAVGFLHAFVNPVHERRVRDILAEELPDIPVSLSSDVSPEMREWERFSTTVANAYVQPLMARYLRRLAEELRAIGSAAPLFMMLSGGGLTTIDTACRFPIRLVESGPAGGAIFSATIARQCGIANVLSFDMGGTTAKICLIDDGDPQTARSFEIARVGRFRKGSGLPLRIPVIEMVEIGAGGGSIAHVDTMGRIAVGPESAGAEPGPACYGRGGFEPAVTDANLTLGRYDPARFAGGTMKLDIAAAHDALASRVGGPLGLTAEMAALGVIEMVDENMANAARVHAIEFRQDLRRPHPDRVRRRWPSARVPCRGKSRHPPGAGAFGRRCWQRHRLPARSCRLRGRSQPLSALFHLRRRCGEHTAGRYGSRSRGRGRAGQLWCTGCAAPHRLYALCRPRPRNSCAAATASTRRRRRSPHPGRL